MMTTRDALIQGARFTVATHFARLSWWRSAGPGAWSQHACAVPRGATIEYVGRRRGPGSDTVAEDTFAHDHPEFGRIVGAFTPAPWGSVDLSVIEPEEW